MPRAKLSVLPHLISELAGKVSSAASYAHPKGRLDTRVQTRYLHEITLERRYSPRKMDIVSALHSEEELQKVVSAYEGADTLTPFASAAAWSQRYAFWQAQNTHGDAFKTFNVAQFLDGLSTRVLARTVLYAYALPSTQAVMFQYGHSLPASAICVTDIQSQGKGRGDNQWDSPPGCLMFTLNCSLAKGESVPMVQYLGCLAIRQAVGLIPEYGSLDVRIKWPNDIYVNKSIKIGGILCQSVFRNGAFQISIGIGLNVDNAQPTTCLNALANTSVRREVLLARIVERFETLFLDFVENGFTPQMKKDYEAGWLHTGQVVHLQDKGGREAVIEGIGVNSGGCLVAIDKEDGSQYELYPDGNRLDFFSGLVSKKVA